ncbi:MAG: response regulator receiver protein [Segetibacter sp.]|nr:response regulator receiver protein [Segetibacter sp.]
MSQNLTLLIVDDDEDDKEMFIEVATDIDASITCIKAANGFDALQLLKKEEIIPDFIFLDLNMPRMNGKQCLEHLKKNERLTLIPVIIYTTSKSSEDKEEVKKLGAVHFITKPSSMIALKKELEFVFSKKWEKSGTM